MKKSIFYGSIKDPCIWIVEFITRFKLGVVRDGKLYYYGVKWHPISVHTTRQEARKRLAELKLSDNRDFYFKIRIHKYYRSTLWKKH